MTPLTRTLTALSHKEPDRVPLFLLLTLHGAPELGLPIQQYFSKGQYVAEGQLRLQRKFGHDCLYAFFYAAVELEAWGGEAIFRDDGPPNAGPPVVRRRQDILSLVPPTIEGSPSLHKVLDAIRLLKVEARGEIPIIGVVMSPYSIPVMQMGFGPYLELLYEDRPLFDRLMQVNEDFCVQWANAQLAAGATAICYFDPVSSPSITPRELCVTTGFAVARRTLARIKGPVATHYASGRSLTVLDLTASTGTAAVGVSALENLAELKADARGKVSLIGNLNGIQMVRWTAQDAAIKVQDAIAKAAPGGGFILSDNHGEIPLQVPEETLHAIAEATRTFGQYPIAATVPLASTAHG